MEKSLPKIITYIKYIFFYPTVSVLKSNVFPSNPEKNFKSISYWRLSSDVTRSKLFLDSSFFLPSMLKFLSIRRLRALRMTSFSTVCYWFKIFFFTDHITEKLKVAQLYIPDTFCTDYTENFRIFGLFLRSTFP